MAGASSAVSAQERLLEPGGLDFDVPRLGVRGEQTRGSRRRSPRR